MSFVEAVNHTDGGWFWLMLLVLVAMTFLIYGSILTIGNVKEAKYESFSRKYSALTVPSYEEQDEDDEKWFDLHDYTKWLAEKGALREGFGEDNLVQDYIS